MMPPTSPTSARSSRYSPSLASPHLSHCTKTSGRATPAGPAHRPGRSSMSDLICTRSKRVVRHGYAASAVVDIQRPSAGCGPAGIRNSQPRRWRTFVHFLIPRLSYDDPSLMPAPFHRTCFWAGDTFAPKLRVRDHVPIQRFLQDAFLDMWETVVRAIGDLDSVIGFEVRPLASFVVTFFSIQTTHYTRTDDERATSGIHRSSLAAQV
jgi:hypothetical protein